MAEKSSWLSPVFLANALPSLNDLLHNRVTREHTERLLPVSKIPGASVSFSQVKMVHPSNPMASEAIAVRDRNAARLPVTYGGKRLGNEPIEEAYIYPRIGPLTRDEVLQTVMAILKRSGRAQPLTFTFADGTARRRSLPEFSCNQGEGFRQAVTADDVINIQ